MANKKEIKEPQIVSSYMEYVLLHDKKPNSIYNFAKTNDFDESIFYKFFGSFEALETAVLRSFIESTLTTLNKSKEYATFDARHKLLSFYFTFFENLTMNRSFVLYIFKGMSLNLKSSTQLKALKKAFVSYFNDLDIETADLKQEQLEKFKNESLKETAWLQLLVTIKFWMDDSSTSFEKTDIFIEKSVNTSFDLINTKPLQSLFDLGKFLIKEKMHLN